MNPLKHVHIEAGLALYAAHEALNQHRIPSSEFAVVRDAYKSIQAKCVALDLMLTQRGALQTDDAVFNLANVTPFVRAKRKRARVGIAYRIRRPISRAAMRVGT